MKRLIATCFTGVLLVLAVATASAQKPKDYSSANTAARAKEQAAAQAKKEREKEREAEFKAAQKAQEKSSSSKDKGDKPKDKSDKPKSEGEKAKDKSAKPPKTEAEKAAKKAQKADAEMKGKVVDLQSSEVVYYDDAAPAAKAAAKNTKTATSGKGRPSDLGAPTGTAVIVGPDYDKKAKKAADAKLDAESPVSMSRFNDGISHWDNQHNLRESYSRYSPNQYREIAYNLVEWQNPDGGWPKNIDYLGAFDVDAIRAKIDDGKTKNGGKGRLSSTLDNHNTHSQIAYLAEAYALTGDANLRESATRGIGYVLDLQNASGGWRGWDVDAITFNDGVMTGAMNLLLEVSKGNKPYQWVDAATRARCAKAFDRALATVLKCQIVVNGEKTVWCQQHDHRTLAPCKARSYELPSQCSQESAGMALFLMSLPPTPEIVAAVRGAAKWFESHKITGIDVIETKDTELINSRTEVRVDKVVVPDPTGKKTFWTRYYEIETGRPFFCNRDGIKVYSLAEVEHERRTGYGWYNTSGNSLAREYKKWENNLKK